MRKLSGEVWFFRLFAVFYVLFILLIFIVQGSRCGFFSPEEIGRREKQAKHEMETGEHLTHYDGKIDGGACSWQ